MRHLRMTARPPLERAPDPFRLLIASEHVSTTRWVSWNFADSRGITVLLHVKGDGDAVRESVEEASPVVSADVVPADAGGFHLLATLDPSESPLMSALYEAVTHDGVVMFSPVARQEGAIEVRLVGQASAVSKIIEALPSGVEVDVHEVGGGGLPDDPTAVPLTDRQREAVRAALDLGYYDQPREATHEDVAAAIGCAPSTASEHLRKAESRLARAAMAAR